MRVNRGLLEALQECPEVRITQGSSVIVAPKVLLESPEIMVLKGPKHVRLVQDRDGKTEEYRATCDGDMIIDSSAEHNRLWMKDRCVVRTVTEEDSPNQSMVLNSDRIQAVLVPGGRGMESLLALGHVRALRQTDLTTLYGDRLFYRFSDQNLRVYGSPRTVADTGHSTSTQGEIRVFSQKHPRTGELVRYTEMIGDSDGVRIEIDERAETKTDEKKK